MNKSLTPLETLERIKEFYPQWHLYNRKDFALIETAFMRLERLEIMHSNALDKIEKDRKKLKALEIIKEHFIFSDDPYDKVLTQTKPMIKEKVDLLKEVLL